MPLSPSIKITSASTLDTDNHSIDDEIQLSCKADDMRRLSNSSNLSSNQVQLVNSLSLSSFTSNNMLSSASTSTSQSNATTPLTPPTLNPMLKNAQEELNQNDAYATMANLTETVV